MVLGPLWQLNIVVAAASLAFVAGLVYVYGRNLRSLRSLFTVGLFLFGALFVVQSLMAIVVYISMADQGFDARVALPMLALNVTGLIGFASLFLVSWR